MGGRWGGWGMGGQIMFVDVWGVRGACMRSITIDMKFQFCVIFLCFIFLFFIFF